MRDYLAVNIADNFDSPFGQTKQVGDLVSLVISAAITIASVTFVFLLIGGGIKMIASAGSDDARGAAQGKQAVTAAVIGFIIVIVAFLIVKAIEIATGVSVLSLPV